MSVRRIARSALVVGGLVTGPVTGLWAQGTEVVRERIRVRLEATPVGAALEVAGRPILAQAAVRQFYQDRVYEPAWTTGTGARPIARSLLTFLPGVAEEGLHPEDYHLATIRTRLRAMEGEPIGAPALAELDLLMTDAFLVVASHLLMGRVDPETIDAEWIANRRGANLSAQLEVAATAGSVDAVLEALRPPQAGYRQLRAARRRYAELARSEPWELIPPGWDEPDRRARYHRLARRRLVRLGDLSGGEAQTDTATLASALERFQLRHGLPATRQLDSATVRALNVSPGERLRQIDVNLERWRWLPQDLGARHIEVNIAAFALQVVDGESVPLTMRVVVGRDYRRTPVFSGSMTYLVLAPYWHVPTTIAVRDKLPLIRRNPAYLRQQRYQVFAGWGADAQEVDPDSVDWSTVTGNSFPYRLRQDPGPSNALGDVKFMFPNKFNVYLHDTPQRELFGETERTFSSGCIRLADPIALATYLLADQPAWSPDVVNATIERGRETTVRLTRPIPVHLLYWTAWAERDGTVQFRRDVYARDARLEAALQERPVP